MMEFIAVTSIVNDNNHHILMWDVDKPFDSDDAKYLHEFAEKHKCPLLILKSSDEGFHIISFNIYYPWEIDRMQMELREHFGKGDYLSLIEVYAMEERTGTLHRGNALRISKKGGKNRPQFIRFIGVPSMKPVSKKHIDLYEFYLNMELPITQRRINGKISLSVVKLKGD